MRFASRLVSVSALVLVPVAYAHAQDSGKILALDFRMTTVTQGAADTGVITGRAIGTADKMRLDVTMKGAGAHISPLSGPLESDSTASIIVTDSGKTVTYLDAKKSQYVTVRLMEMIARAKEMGGVTMEYSGTESRVDSLGTGPTILGHPTSHYRVTMGTTMTISTVGMVHTVKLASLSDSYYAIDLKGNLNPFASLNGVDMLSIFGSTSKDFADKMNAVQKKLPKGMPLRTLSSATMVDQGQTKVTNATADVTAIKWVTADPKAFEIPSMYTAVQLPGMGGSSGAIPPR
jgi:hypothetical protein